jgi:hypothetical protein
MSRARQGKVARLSAIIREEINKRLYDGASGVSIRKWLGTKGEAAAAVSEQNLSEWRNGGYQDWLKSETQMRRIRERAELAMRMAHAAGGSLGESIVNQLAGQIDEKLDGLGDEEVSALKPLLDTILQAEKLQLEKKKVAQKDEQIGLARDRFQRETAELFIKWAKTQEVSQILAARDSDDNKMERLVKTIFGERPVTPEG